MIITDELRKKTLKRLNKVYKGTDTDAIFGKIAVLFEKYPLHQNGTPKPRAPYSHKDVFLITYGDSIKKEGEYPLHVLNGFLERELRDIINNVHILPFFPYSSDDGFSVVDYKQVREDLGNWEHITRLSRKFRVMADLVVNHISSKSKWFEDFLDDKEPGKGFFHVMDPSEDLSMVTRPRSTPVLTPVQTKSGKKHVWTTFSADQVDVNFSNPDVLVEYIDILLFYLSKGVRVIRLDAVAFLWKKPGTNSIHLEETHEIVKLFRDIIESAAPDAILITETNVPHKENISYFGDGDEAHMVYNFSLPPLLLHALLTENASYLSEWSRKLTPPPDGCTYFNFAASHDGIGVRPLEGLVPEDEFERVVKAVIDRGGKVSYKQNPNGIESPYELNITYFDAFADADSNDINMQIRKFLCSQALMLGFRGVPAIYIHSLTATPNYVESIQKTGLNRTINRRKWDLDELERLIGEPASTTGRVFHAWKKLLMARRSEPAFNPLGEKEVLDTPPEIFAMRRACPNGKHRIIIAANVSSREMDWECPVHFTKAVNLLSGSEIAPNPSIRLMPFQVMWLKYG